MGTLRTNRTDLTLWAICTVGTDFTLRTNRTDLALWATCATCTGCCDNNSCLAKSAQTSSKCGTGVAGADCSWCPIGTFCQGGGCVDCATNCPQGCCNTVGDCILYSDQSDTKCGKDGQGCMDCSGAVCISGGCWI